MFGEDLLTPNSTAINLTKLDILDSFPTIKVATAYINPVTGEEIEGFPADLELLEKVEVKYQEFEGWQKPIGQCRSFYDLPLKVSVPTIGTFSLPLQAGSLKNAHLNHDWAMN